MDFAASVAVVGRHWIVAILAFLSTLALTAMVYTSIPKVYVSTAVLVLTMPTTGATASTDPQHPNGVTNPLMDFDPGLSLTASIEIQSLDAPETVAMLGLAPGGDTSYLVSDGSTNPELAESSPFIYIQGTSSDPEAAQDIVKRLSGLVGQDLAEKQKRLQAPESTYISVSQVVPATAGQLQKGTRARAAGATFALGVFASLFAAFASESISTRRKQRRESGNRHRRDGAHPDDAKGSELVPAAAP
jgi:hypothetical protein